MEAYRYLIEKHKNRIKIIPWDLAIREYENKKNNKYIQDGKYTHQYGIWIILIVNSKKISLIYLI